MKTTKPKPVLPGVDPCSVTRNAIVFPLIGGLVIISHSCTKGYHVVFHECTGNSTGTRVNSIAGAVRQAKKYSEYYTAQRSRHNTMRELAEELIRRL